MSTIWEKRQVAEGEKALAAIEKTVEAFNELKSKQKRNERIILLIACIFVIGISFAAWYNDTPVLEKTMQFIKGIEGNKATASRNAAQNCLDPSNIKTAYCQERKAKIDAEWESMTRYGKGKTTPFNLYGKKY